MTDVELVRGLEKDHKPDGFPAVEMALLTRMADRVVELEAFIKGKASEQEYLDGTLSLRKERDALKSQLDNAIKDAASWKKCFEQSIDDHARTSGKLARTKMMVCQKAKTCKESVGCLHAEPHERAFALLDEYFEPISRKEQVKLDDEDSEKLRAEVARLTEENRAAVEKEKDNKENYRRLIKNAGTFLKMWVDGDDWSHEDPMCPEDDTCECENVEQMNELLKIAAAIREGKG